jgi:hypothetical protein
VTIFDGKVDIVLPDVSGLGRCDDRGAFNASAPPSARTAALTRSAGPSWAAANWTSVVLASNAADTPNRYLKMFSLLGCQI